MKQNKHFTTIFFALIFSIIFFTSGNAQPVFPNNLTVTNQYDVNYWGNFLNTNGYTSIGGNLIIQFSTDITDLYPLNGITSVGGNLEIYTNAALTNLTGLESLTSVGGYVLISTNNSLTSFDGLASLNSFNKLIIQRNPALTNLTGLENLTLVSGSIEIAENAAMTNLVGLDNLTSVDGNLTVHVNNALTNLEGLGALTSVGGDLFISNNPVQTDLYGLENLTSVSGKLDIQRNANMTNVDGLASLTSVGGNLQLHYCDALANLDGLESLTFVGGAMYIMSNLQLVSFCGLHPLLTEGTYGDVIISENGIRFPYPPGAVQTIIDDGPCAGSVTTVDVDIYPGTCPNELNVKGKGAISVAILGTGDFDVQNIDPATLLLEGISPLRWGIEDVATPASNGEQCDCTIDGPDGFVDLTLKFDAKSLIAALGEVNNGDELSLTMTGDLLDGTAFEGSDCVIIAGKKLGKDLDGNLSNVPGEYALFENYPNPFNPSTTINYQLADQGYVSLIVYDLLGREVATLVNEVKQSGYYQVEFNAAGLPSGVYMYRLQAGDYGQTLKMILMK